MQLVQVNDTLAPIRLLRQVGPLSDEELIGFLERERDFLRSEEGSHWISVIDIRRFDGASDRQRELLRSWLQAEVGAIGRATAGVAFVVTPRLRERAQAIADILDGASIETRVTLDLDEALDWAIQLTYELDVDVAPDLVINGVDAFRPALV